MDTISRERRGRRLHVTVQHNPSFAELCSAFVSIHLLAPDLHRGPHTPPTRTLLERVKLILWLQGCQALDRQPCDEQLQQFAAACATKVWNSRLVLMRA
jgi:hypothetical protein